MTFRPMLACDFDAAKLKFPVLASPKLDGIRCIVMNGKLFSRSLKPIPSRHINEVLGSMNLDGLDGELVVGDATAPDCYNRTTSHVMAQDKVFDFTFYVFDHHGLDVPYDLRYDQAHMMINRLDSPSVKFLQHVWLHNEDEMIQYEKEALDQGFEGIMLRDPKGRYKHGRSTVREGILLKVKRFTDSECVILGFEEQMHNTNVKVTNELGRSKRSSHQDGMVGKKTLGALVVRDCVTGIDFNIGTGMDDQMRKMIWDSKSEFLGKIVKYKSFIVGAMEKPRFPVFLGFRDPIDMGEAA